MKKYVAGFLCVAMAPMLVAGTRAAVQNTYVKKLDPALDKIVAPGTAVEKVATGFIFVEGPMWREGKLWFSDVRGDKVRTYDPKTSFVIFDAVVNLDGEQLEQVKIDVWTFMTGAVTPSA